MFGAIEIQTTHDSIFEGFAFGFRRVCVEDLQNRSPVTKRFASRRFANSTRCVRKKYVCTPDTIFYVPSETRAVGFQALPSHSASFSQLQAIRPFRLTLSQFRSLLTKTPHHIVGTHLRKSNHQPFPFVFDKTQRKKYNSVRHKSLQNSILRKGRRNSEIIRSFLFHFSSRHNLQP